MTDPAQYKNNWMKYATPEEIDTHFKALEAREEEIRKSRQFGAAMDLTAKLLSDQGKGGDERPRELAYFGSTKVGYEYYHACRVIYRLGVEAEEMWREVQGRKNPTEDLLERLKSQEYRAESESKDEIIFKRLKKAIDEEVADRPGCTPSRDGGLRYIFNIKYILERDSWSRHVQGRLIGMNQWTNAMMYAYDKILEKLWRTDRGSFNATVNHHDNFKGYGYWDNGEYIALEERIEKYQKVK